MGKEVKIRNKKREKLSRTDWLIWGIATFCLFLFISIFMGTSAHYLSSDAPIGLGLYADWAGGAIVIAFAIWGLISLFLFKGRIK